MCVLTNKFQGEQLTSGPGPKCMKCSGVYTVLGRSPDAGKRSVQAEHLILVSLSEPES